MNMNKVEMNDNMMELVNGGTFTPNALTDEQYAKYGIKVIHHVILPDEFCIPDLFDVKGTEEMANAYVKRVAGAATYKSMVKEHFQVKKRPRFMPK